MSVTEGGKAKYATQGDNRHGPEEFNTIFANEGVNVTLICVVMGFFCRKKTQRFSSNIFHCFHESPVYCECFYSSRDLDGVELIQNDLLF